jgi:hypothetical protein
MAGIPVERYDDVAGALQRLGRSWWLWVLLGETTVTVNGHVLLPFVVPVRVALGAYVVFALVRLAEVLPDPEARQLRGLAGLAAIATAVAVSGGAVGGWSSAESTASVALALVGLVLYARQMRSFTAHEPRTVHVVDTWDRAVRWGWVSVAALAAACVVALPDLALASGSHAAHGVRDVAAVFGVVGMLAGVGALLLTARGTSWTRMAFDVSPDARWHGPIVQGPRPPST